MEEIWKEIPGFEDYEVSNLGRVRSFKRKSSPGYVMSPGKPERGYRNVCLMKHGCGFRFRVCRLVLLAFRGPCPDGMEACHNDGDSKNDHLDNLRYDTHLANMQDRRRHGSRIGPPRTIDPDEVGAIRAEYALGEYTQAQLARKYGHGEITINHILLARGPYRNVGKPITIRHMYHDPDKIRALRKERAAGKGLVALAAKYNISESMVSLYTTGERGDGAGGPITQKHRHLGNCGKSGVLGIRQKGNKWSAHIRRNSETIYLGCFDTIRGATRAIEDRGGYYET